MIHNFTWKLVPLCAALAAAVPAAAAWPEDRPLEVIVGFAPGGPSDVLVRSLAPHLAKQLGHKANVIVTNRPGAGGELGVAALARARPDGYTIGLVNLPGYFVAPMYKKSNYELKDLRLLARLVRDPQILVVRADSPITSLKQAVEMARARPGTVSIGNNGSGTSGHLGVLRLEEAAGVQFNSIPYSGSAPQRTALIAGDLDMAMLAASEIPDPAAFASRMRILTQFAATPSEHIKSVPTTHDQGFKVELYSERGLATPTGVPAQILSELRAALERAVKDPAFIRSATADGPYLAFLGGDEWTASMERDRTAFADIVRKLPKP